jgi:hypothetical protein
MCDARFLKSELFLRYLLNVIIDYVKFKVLVAVLMKIQVMT